jgi:hypothetical protein
MLSCSLQPDALGNQYSRCRMQIGCALDQGSIQFEDERQSGGGPQIAPESERHLPPPINIETIARMLAPWRTGLLELPSPKRRFAQ